jgi:hypothetical protein
VNTRLSREHTRFIGPGEVSYLSQFHLLNAKGSVWLNL